MPAWKTIRAAELRAICTTCASSVLASKSNIGADLRAPCGVRMVWWGFRALKTPEERPHCRRFSVGWLIYRDCSITGQILDRYWTKTGRTMDEMDHERLAYGLREAAEKLGGVSVRSVRRLVARGALPTVRVFRRVLIPAEALRAFVASADPTHNSARAESVAWKESKPWHTDARTHRTGGSSTPTQAARELTGLLAQLTARKHKHSKPNGG